MVFHGGFSRGCRTCLKRRVKCDEGKPTCQRCLRAKKECLGYRDDNDLAFKDETASTVRKAHHNNSHSGSESQFIWPSKSPTRSNSSRNVDQKSPVRRSFQQRPLSPEDLEAAEINAVQQFITHFAEPAAKCNASQGFFPYTKRFWRVAAPDTALRLTLVALALTMTASSSSSSLPSSTTLQSETLLKRQALIRYGDAMRKLSEALNDPVESRSDGTIITIVLLANLGDILDTPAPVPHGIVHGTAAAHILRARGREMIKDEELLQLLMRMRLILAYSHAICALPVQDLVDDNDQEALSWSELPTHIRTHPTHLLNTLALPVADLRARVKHLLTLPVDGPSVALASTLVKECIEAESALQCWLRDIPDDWKEDIIDHQGIYVRISDTEVLRPCPGVRGLSRYRDAWVSNQHYAARDFRAFLQAMIIRCGTWVSSNKTATNNHATKNQKGDDGGLPVQEILSSQQLEDNLALLGFPGLKPMETLQDVVDSLCRAIFYNLRATPPHTTAAAAATANAMAHGNHTTDTTDGNVDQDPKFIISNTLHDLRPAVGAPYLIVRPLMIANSAVIAPAAQQRWIKSVLRIVGNQLEMSTASMLAETPLAYPHPLFGVHPLANLDTTPGSSTDTSTSTNDAADTSTHTVKDGCNDSISSPPTTGSTSSGMTTSSPSLNSLLQTPSPH